MRIQKNILFLFALGLASASAEPRIWPDFQGNPGLPTAFTGTFQNTVVILSLDSRIVQGMLPSEASLVPQTLTGSGQHPVFLMSAQFSKMEIPGVPAFGYNEFLIYIPSVHLREGVRCETDDHHAVSVSARSRTAFMPVLYLNEKLPVDLGVQFSGLNKIQTRVDAAQDSYQVFEPGSDSRKIFSARFGAEENLDLIGFTRALRIMDAMPASFVGKLQAQISPAQETVWTGWDLDWAHAQVRSIRSADIEFNSEWLGRVKLTTSGLNQRMLGAFRYRVVAKGSPRALCTWR